jgi:hypothetical protein
VLSSAEKRLVADMLIIHYDMVLNFISVTDTYMYVFCAKGNKPDVNPAER